MNNYWKLDRRILKYQKINGKIVNLIENKMNNFIYTEDIGELNDVELFQKIEYIHICSDSVYELPEFINKFTKLKKLTLEGTRSWELTCKNIPASIRYLDIKKLGNLYYSFFEGFEKFTNLRRLDINVNI